MKRLAILTVICITIALACYLLLVPRMFRLESTSPSGKTEVRGLPFQGKMPNDLDGTLRLYIGDHKQQTTINFSRELSISWDNDSQSEAFSINEGDVLLMKWQVNSDHATCIEGANYLVADPYKK